MTSPVRVANRDLNVDSRRASKPCELDLELEPSSPQIDPAQRTQLAEQGTVFDQLDHVAVMSPEKALIFVSRGNFRGNSGDLEGALEDFERAFALEPEAASYDWHLSRANVRVQLGHWEGAIEDASEVLAVRPDHAWALEIRGMARGWTGDRTGALEDFTRSIDSGQRPSTYMQRGTCLSYLERFDEAVVDLERARELGYRSPVLTNNLAEALDQVGRTAEAVALLATETDPLLVELRVRLEASRDSE